MGALERRRGAGFTVELTGGDTLRVSPRVQLTEELCELTRSEKPGIIAALHSEHVPSAAWLLRFAKRDPVEFCYSPAMTMREAPAMRPDAVAADPLQRPPARRPNCARGSRPIYADDTEADRTQFVNRSHTRFSSHTPVRNPRDRGHGGMAKARQPMFFGRRTPAGLDEGVAVLGAALGWVGG